VYWSLFFTARVVTMITTPEVKSTALSTRLDIIAIELDNATAIAFAISNIFRRNKIRFLVCNLIRNHCHKFINKCLKNE